MSLVLDNQVQTEHQELKMLPKISKFGPVFLVAVAVVVVALAGCSGPDTALLEPADAKVAGTVDLEIDFKSEREKIEVAIPCSADSTVFSILTRAKNLGDLDFESRGTKPANKFVTSIGGVENQADLGWVFRVNGELADKGCGEFAVAPGDHVQWVFGSFP